MRSLYLRIWLTVVAVLALFALTSGWLLHRHLDQERQRADALVAERMTGWGNLIENSLPERDASDEDQGAALREWSRRLRVPLALEDMRGRRIATTEAYRWREQQQLDASRRLMIQLDDGRRLLMLKPNFGSGLRLGPSGERGGGPHGEGGAPGDDGPPYLRPPEAIPRLPGSGLLPDRLPHDGPPPLSSSPWPVPQLGLDRWLPSPWAPGAGLVLMLVLQFVAVAAGAYPVVRSLTRRLERLKQGVEAFGAGALHLRVDASGRDEVASLGSSFNQAAQRIEALVQANQSLLANASHELRSPLARLKMAVAMLDSAAPAQREALAREINTNIGELDALVEEVLLSSRLEAGNGSGAAADPEVDVDLLGLVVEQASRQGVEAHGPACTLRGSDRLLRRAVRNLLENAARYGGGEVSVELQSAPGEPVRILVCDRGPGVPESERERIFEPFYRMSGHAEREGGVGLGLALVRQIARRHEGTVHCEAREGGGSCFVISLPAARRVNGAEPRP